MGNSMISSAILLDVFEKLTSVYFQIAQEIMRLSINNIHKKVT